MDQITSHILMVRPAQFSYNAETAKNNAFQTRDEFASSDVVREKAMAEFDALVDLLRSRAIHVFVWQDTPTPAKPDAVSQIIGQLFMPMVQLFSILCLQCRAVQNEVSL